MIEKRLEEIRDVLNATGNAVIDMRNDQIIDLRDRFAMAALTGLLQQGYDKFDPDEWSHQAYAYADAMMKARESDG